LKEVDADLQRSLNLAAPRGALVQDVTAGSPGDRAGLRAYDLILALDDREVATDDQLISEISSRSPGTAVRLRLIRDGREQMINVKLAERPARDGSSGSAPPPAPLDRRLDQDGPLGLTVRDIDRQAASRLNLPDDIKGVLITRVEALSPTFEGGIERGTVLLEINRQSVPSVAEFRRIARAAQPGDVLTLYVYSPELDQRELKTVRIDER
jgi:serine protease Do